ncbi:MAG TPA: hypothetical protein VHB98_17905 [Chloroflexota bacterium]|nr:hypothetical protein [Chloroflexota bacterium]
MARVCRKLDGIPARHPLGDKPGFAECFEGLAVVAAAIGQPLRAARLFGAAEAVRETIGRPVEIEDRAVHERTIPAVCDALGEEECAAAWAAGRAIPLEQVIAEALGDAPGGDPQP